MSKTTNTYYSNGKLLISGEYFVLKGALALAVPVRYGQRLTVNDHSDKKSNLIHWKSRYLNKPWFEGTLFADSLSWKMSNNHNMADFLSLILKQARRLNPEFLESAPEKDILSQVDFDINWGLGSSSSLVSNISQWAEVNAFELNKLISAGSGYDIACALRDNPIFYQTSPDKPLINPVNFNPEFKKYIYFAPVGIKQSSEKSIAKSKKLLWKVRREIDMISEITKKMATAKSLQEFIMLVKEHELIVSRILKLKRIKDVLFNDFKGEIKSLGAWGGDFMMLIWEHSREDLKNYLAGKQIYDLFSFDELVLNRQNMHN